MSNKKVKILVMSDSHRRYGIVDKVMNAHPDADAFIHCGDLQEDRTRFAGLAVVAGNGDYDPTMPKELVLTIGGHNIYVTHSHLFPYFDKNMYLTQRAQSLGCDIVFYGHTHVPDYEVIEGVTLVNPGSLYYNRDYTKPSYAIITISNEIDVEFVHIG